MKKITLVLGVLFSLLIISCEGPEGPPGFDGENGVDGIQGQVFEVNGIDFTYNSDDNLYETIITYINYTNFEVLKQDAILVYRFDGTVPLNDGADVDSWGLIPQNFFLPEGTMQYVSSHTLVDVQILIDGNFNLASLSSDFTQNQIFRIVIIPSEFASSGKMDTSNISSVMNSLGIQEKDVHKIILD